MDIVSALRNSVGALSGRKYSSGERIICHTGRWRDGVTSPADEVFLFQAIDDLGNGWEGDVVRFGHFTRDATWMLLGIKEDLRLGERRLEPGRLSPEDLPKGRTKKRVQELQQALCAS